jgi:FkbM family methyltransferase
LKALIRNLAKQFGYEVFGPPRAFANQRTIIGLLRQEQINLVLDVGANTGQFAGELRACGYTGRIVSFEPLAAAHAQLRSHASTDPNWTIAERTAVGATHGSIEIHVSKNSVSSSILAMLPAHSEAEPQSAYVETETVPLNRLDDLYSPTPADRVLLKIDVQGYEPQVIEGAANLLSTCRAVILELSLVPLYKGQLLAKDMWEILAARGFQPWSFEPGFRHPETGRMLQLDGIFVRNNAD